MADRESLEQDATTDEGIWRECAERLRIAIAAESENRKNGIEAIKFRWGEQWPDDVKNSRKTQQRPALTINHTNISCQRQENTLRQQRPRIKVHPVGDGANVDTAATVQGIIRHIENRSYSSVAYDRGAKGAIDIGWGYWRVRSDYLGPKSFDQELLIVPIRNHFSVYMDPLAVFPDGRDQKWCIITEMIKRREYKRRYPKASNADFTHVDAPGDEALLNLDWEGKEDIRLAEYYRIHEVRDTLCLMSDGQIVFKSELLARQAALREAIAWTQAIGRDGKPVERPTSRVTVEWFRLDGKNIVERRIIPGRYIPVIRSEGNVEEIDGRTMRKGMVQDLIDPARMLNYWRTMQTERYALAPKAPWVMAEGQADGHPEWNDANQKSYSTLVYKPVVVTTAQGDQLVPAPERQPPAPVEEGMAQAAAGAEHDLMSVAGMPQENPELQARIIGGNKYLQRRQGMQDLAHFQYSDNQTLAIAWTGEVLLELIPHYYDTQRMQRIIGEDGVPQVVTINEKSKDDSGVERVKNDMTVGLYAVVMDTGPDYGTRREEAAENMMEMLNTPLGEVVVKTGPDLVVRNMDFHGADELADRMAASTPGGMEKIMEGLPKQAQTIIVALQQQLQQKDQLIQQQALEIKYQGAVKEMQIHGQLEKTDRDNETKIRDTVIRGHTARDVAEIGAAAQLLNTKAESDEAERASQRLIAAGTKDRAPNGAGE